MGKEASSLVCASGGEYHWISGAGHVYLDPSGSFTGLCDVVEEKTKQRNQGQQKGDHVSYQGAMASWRA